MAILKAGIRLWDGSVDNPVAAIKVVRHALLRPTSLIHESGHHVAHMLAWNTELARVIGEVVGRGAPGHAQTWAGWASEIAADAFAFAHTGCREVVTGA